VGLISSSWTGLISSISTFLEVVIVEVQAILGGETWIAWVIKH
jgi:hypothetical protein